MIRFADTDSISILVLFGDSTGEIDWLLPVLHVMKEQKGESLKLVFITQTDSLRNKLDADSYYGEQLRNLGKLYTHGSDKSVDFAAIDVMLKADDPDNEVTEYYRSRLPGVPVVIFPSGTAILSRRHDTDEYLKDYFDFIFRKTGREIRDSQGPHAIWMTTSPELEPMARQFSTMQKIRHIGCPRYEDWWMNKVNSERKSSSKNENDKRHVLFVIRGPHWLYQSAEDYESLMRDFMEEACERSDMCAVIKPHPRQDRGELEKLLSAYDDSKWAISDLSLTELTQQVDVVVCMFSSGVLDAIAAGKPVAEFFHYHDRMPVMEYRRNSEGRMISIYEDLGLVRNLKNREELRGFLDAELGSGNKNSTDEETIKIFDEVTMRRHSPSQKASDLIFRLAENKKKAANRLEKISC